MNVILGADHAATALKENLKTALAALGYAITDMSPAEPLAGDDYPDYAIAVAKAVARHPEGTLGIIVCDTGIGMAIAANKVRGIRAALVVNELGARRAREHNDAHVLVLGSAITTPEDAVRFAELFLRTPFSGEERHVRRLKKITEGER